MTDNRITIWDTWNKKTKSWHFHHTDRGHAEGDRPETSEDSIRVGWAKLQWRKTHTHIRDKEIIRP